MIIRLKIKRNPYRILGIYVGDSPAKEASNISRIAAFSKINRTTVFPMRADDFFGKLQRTEKMAAEAAQKLSLTKDRVGYALLWYSDKKEPWADYLNNAVSCLIDNKPISAMAHYGRLLSDEEARNGFMDAATYGIMKMDKDQLATILLDALSSIDFNKHLNYEEITGGEDLLARWFLNHKPKKLEWFSFDGLTLCQCLYRLKGEINSLRPTIVAMQKIYGIDNAIYMEYAEKVGFDIYNYAEALIFKIDTSRNNGYNDLYYLKKYFELLKGIEEWVEASCASLQFSPQSETILKEKRSSFEKNIEFKSNALQGDIKEMSRTNILVDVIFWVIMFCLFFLI